MKIKNQWRKTHFGNTALDALTLPGDPIKRVARVWEVHDRLWMWEVNTGRRVISPVNSLPTSSAARSAAVEELEQHITVEWV